MFLRIFISLCLVLSMTELSAQPVTFTIDIKRKAQAIDNIGASAAWFSENIGKFWPAEKKERMAELLFSKAFDKDGHPLGIGLSAFRFNIGGGTTEQGDSSGIRTAIKRVECFLLPDGKYDWTKQQGYMWFVRKAASYGVENLIAFSNTPPVQFTKNGLGFKTEKNFETNLRDDKYTDYAVFLANIVEHFDKEKIHFNYISPVNEPQWDWSNKFGQMNQEGSPWHNKDIYTITRKLDSVLTAKKVSSEILITEAGILSALYGGNSHASRQIQHFYSKDSGFYVGNMVHVLPVIAGHSYFTDNGDTNLISIRKNVHDTVAKYHTQYWQSEYSMLGNGYKEGLNGRIKAIDGALFLAKVIYHDFVVGNATAWQWWNSWEPSSPDFDTRYCLLALKTNPSNTEGDFTITKNLWALGHYSRFIRPGMQRIIVERSDRLDDLQIAKDVMLSAYANQTQVTIVAINYTQADKEVQLSVTGIKKVVSSRLFITSENDDMKPYPAPPDNIIKLPARSIATLILSFK